MDIDGWLVDEALRTLGEVLAARGLMCEIVAKTRLRARPLRHAAWNEISRNERSVSSYSRPSVTSPRASASTRAMASLSLAPQASAPAPARRRRPCTPPSARASLPCSRR